MKKLLPLIFLLFGSAAGGGVGFVLRPAPPEMPAEMAKDATESGTKAEEPGAKDEEPDSPVEYVKLNNQFVVPVVKNRVVISLVVMALSLEAPEGSKEARGIAFEILTMHHV